MCLQKLIVTSWTLSNRFRTRPFLDADSNDAVQRTTLYYSVLHSTTPVLFCTTPVLLCTTKYYPVLLCTTEYYSSTTLYYSVLESSTLYYSSTTLYYKVLLQYHSVLHSTTPVRLRTTQYYSSTTLYYKVPLCTTKYYSSTTPYYKVLLQYYSVLQCNTPVYYKMPLQYYSVLQSATKYYSVLHGTTPVLLCTTKYYSSTTLYYQVLLQYYSVLQSTTPVLLCTTKYYSSTTLYYKVLLQYYSVLQSTTPVLLCTTKYYSSTTLYYKVLLQYYSHDWSASPMNLYLHYAEQQRCCSNITECCACHAKWLSWLIRITYETLFTMRGATEMSLQHHRILRLPRKVTLIIDPLHTWDVIYNARSNKSQPPTSPNTVPATKNESHDWSSSQMKRYLQCAEQHVSLSKLTKYCACHEKWLPWLILVTHETLFTMRRATCVIVQTHQILRLPRKMTVQNLREICWKRMKRHFQCATDPSMIREWNRPSATRLATEVTFHAHREHFVLKNTTFRAPAIIPNFTEYCACHEKWHFNFTKYCACHEK